MTPTHVFRFTSCLPLLFVLNGCAANVDTSSQGEQTGSTAQALNPAKWQGWGQIPNGTGQSTPAMVGIGGSLDLFILGNDNAIWYNYWSPLTDWIGYSQIPNGFFESTPAATTYGVNSDNTAVAAIGDDNRVWLGVFEGSGHQTFSGWQPIPGQTCESAPALATQPRGFVLYAFCLQGQRMQFATNDVSNGYNAATWSAWAQVPDGPLLESGPAAVTSVDLELAAQGADGYLYLNETGGVDWNGWTRIPGLFQTPVTPALSSWSLAHIDVYANVSNHIQVNSRDGTTWSGWSQIPIGSLRSNVAAVSLSEGSVDVVAQGQDTAFWRDHYQQ